MNVLLWILAGGLIGAIALFGLNLNLGRGWFSPSRSVCSLRFLADICWRRYSVPHLERLVSSILLRSSWPPRAHLPVYRSAT